LKKILFITPFEIGLNPSQRFRCEHFYDELVKEGYQIKIAPFFKKKAWLTIYSSGHFFKKAHYTALGFINRVLSLFSIGKYDFVFIAREATPLGPPFFEWIITKLFNKHVIYDLDDGIWQINENTSNRITRFLKFPNKVNNIIKWANMVAAGSPNILSYCQSLNANCKLIPTVVDLKKHHNQQIQIIEKLKYVVGWTGSHSTLTYLAEIQPQLLEAYSKNPFKLVVICDRAPQFSFPELEFIQWNAENEITDLLNFDIGIMPLPNNNWTKYKCGFKLIQYMALGIPAIASAVAVNKEIGDADKNAILLLEEQSWASALNEILTNYELRRRIGPAGRKKVKEIYSKEAVTPLFLALFTSK